MELKEIENIGFNRYLKIYSLIGVSSYVLSWWLLQLINLP